MQKVIEPSNPESSPLKKPRPKNRASGLGLKVFTTGQVAKYCNVSPRTVVKWIDTKGYLKAYRIPLSQDRRVRRGDLIHFMVENGFILPPDLAISSTDSYVLINVPIHKQLEGHKNLNAVDTGWMMAEGAVSAAIIGCTESYGEAVKLARSMKRLYHKVKLAILLSEDRDGVTDIDLWDKVFPSETPVEEMKEWFVGLFPKLEIYEDNSNG